MPKTALKKEKWTLSFDARLKHFLVREARKKGIYPVSLLEQVVRERFNPYGHSSVEDAAAYVHAMRAGSRGQSDASFLKEIREWQKLNS